MITNKKSEETMKKETVAQGINRRSFLQSAAAVGATAVFAPNVLAQGLNKNGKDINVAILGAGAQGQVLLDACMKMGQDSGVKFQAVCDIWESQNLKRVSGTIDKYKKFGHKGTAYTDYQEMLDKEKDNLDAVIVATPDFWHSRHTVACLKAGLHVYCEKEMSNTLEDARKMVVAAKEAGKLLQIGHQRRSNPRYQFCYEKLIKEAKLPGRITTINGQWNRSKSACEDLGWPEKAAMDDATLNKYGFSSMKQFRNWRWYKGLGGGPIVDLGSHQIDVYSWFVEAQPKSVMASGGVDYWGHEWYDSVIAVYEYQTAQGMVRASYQTLTTNSNGGYYETFMGDEGTLLISESSGRCDIYREKWVAEDAWDKWIKKDYIKETAKKEKTNDSGAVVDVRESTVTGAKYALPITMDKPYHQPHLENFFNAIRGKEKLNCPGEIGYETAATVLKVNEAIEKGCKLEFKPEDFKAV
jgi:predicted dehydrogenase